MKNEKWDRFAKIVEEHSERYNLPTMPNKKKRKKKKEKRKKND